MTDQSTSKPRKRLWLGCLGCTGLFIVSCLVLVGAGLLAGPIMQRLRPSAQEIYAAAPDPVASAAVSQVFEDAGVPGVDAVVIPIKGKNSQIAIVSIDETVSGADTVAGDEALFSQVINGLSQANRDGDLKIERVSMFYDLGADGKSVGMTAPQVAIDAYAAGQISKEEFLSRVDVDISSIISYQDMMQLLQEAQK